jgi:ribosomal protein L35
MNKSVSKRIRITKNGKVIRRSMALDHFRTRKSANNIRGKRKSRGLDIPRKALVNYASR